MFFRGEDDGGEWPEVALLEFARPPGYDELTDDELGALIEEATEQAEEKVRREFDAAGRKFLGREAILWQHRHAKPRSTQPGFKLAPKVACRNTERRTERLLEHQQWLVDYKAARKEWLAGNREVLFPYGTYQMRVGHRACCGPPPS